MTQATTGCNTLYPDGRLGEEREFTAEHHLRALDLLVEAGFDAIEYSHPAPLSDEDMNRVSAHAASLGLTSWSLHAWKPLPAADEGISETLEAYADSADRARRLGVQMVVVHSGGGTEPAARETRRRANREALIALAEMLGPDITVTVENGRSRADWEFIVALVRDCALPNVGLNVDTGHANLGDMTVVDCIHMGGDLVRTTHLQDNHGKQDDHLPPGVGTIDWPPVMKALADVGYRGVYMVEISDCPPDREPDARADTFTAARNLRAFLAEAGQ